MSGLHPAKVNSTGVNIWSIVSHLTDLTSLEMYGIEPSDGCLTGIDLLAYSVA
jgi:hypothetical protein